MGTYDVETRQQFIIPTTPMQTFPSSAHIAVDDLNNQIGSSTTESGDSYYNTFTLAGGGMNWNFRFMMNSYYLPTATDYFIATASLNDISGELVMQVTKFVSLVPYPSWRVRVDLSKYPYSKFMVAPISTEGDVTKVTFNQALDWTGSLFGIAPQVRHYWFCSLQGFGVARFPFHIFGQGKSALIPPGVEQFRLSGP